MDEINPFRRAVLARLHPAVQATVRKLMLAVITRPCTRKED